MAGKLAGRSIVVTGASSGIGEAMALLLASEGAKVALVARRADRLDALKAKIEEAGGTALSVVADVANEAQVRAAIETIAAALGGIDVLVNNAGVMLLGPITGADTEDWRRMVSLNILGLMYATHAALPYITSKPGGSIVNISSVAGRQTNPRSAVYSATKFAVGAFSEGLRQEISKTGARVTIVEPGVTDTELRDHITVPSVKDEINQWAASMRQLQSQDVAAAIFYAITQPPHVNVNEILVRPTDQER